MKVGTSSVHLRCFSKMANAKGTSITKVKINLRIILYFSHLSVPLGLRKKKA